MREIPHRLAAGRRHRPGSVRRRARWCWMRPGSRPIHPRRHRLGVLAQEGDALPAAHARSAARDRLRLLRRHHFQAGGGGRAGTGARTAGPAALTYRSPIVRMRQMLDLYICLRPCRAFPRQPAQLPRRHRPGGVPREHRGHVHRRGVSQGPGEFRAEPAMERIPADAAISIRSVTRKASRRIVRSGVRIRREERPAQSDGGAQGQRAARHLRRFPGSRAGGGRAVSADPVRHRQRGRHVHVAAQESARTTT